MFVFSTTRLLSHPEKNNKSDINNSYKLALLLLLQVVEQEQNDKTLKVESNYFS